MDDIMKNTAAFLLFLAVFLPLGAQAETVLRIGENISVDANQVVAGDYYVSVGPLGNTNMSGSVEGDMYAFGGSVTANGSVGSDLTVIGGTSQLHATVTDDVRIIAGEVTLADHVGGDLFVIAGKLTMLSTAQVDGDIIFFGGDAEINGTVGGSILGTSERLRVDASIGKNVDIKTTQFTLGDKSKVGGFVRYESPQQIVRAQNAAVEGEISHTAVAVHNPKNDIQNALIPVFMSLFAALSLFLLFKKELQSLVQNVHVHPLRNALAGFAVMILGPLASILLIATVLGLFVGVAGLALTVFAYMLGYVLSGIVLGGFIMRLFTRKIQVSLLSIILGTLAVHLLYFIPVLGLPIFMIVFVLTLGGVCHYFYKLLS